jgi:hypothetical protein
VALIKGLRSILAQDRARMGPELRFQINSYVLRVKTRFPARVSRPDFCLGFYLLLSHRKCEIFLLETKMKMP